MSTKLSTIRTAATEVKRHVSRADVNRDGRLTKREVSAYAKQPGNALPGRAVATMRSWATRGLGPTATTSVSLVRSKVDDALKAIAAKDKNGDRVLNDGPELNAANRLKTFQALAALSNREELDSTQLGAAIDKHAGDAWYMSESDYNPQYFAVPFAGPVTGDKAAAALEDTLKAFYEETGDMSGYTFERYSAADAKEFLTGLSEHSPDDDTDARKSSRAFKAITDLLGDQLTSIQVMKYGPKDDDGSLATDQGLYAQVVYGKTRDGRLAGIILGDVET